MPRKAKSTKEIEEKRFAKAKLEGANNTQAAMIATGTTSVDVAKTQGHRLSTNVNVQQAILSELETQGVDLSQMVKPVKEALEANKIIVMGKGTDDSFVDVIPDWTARLKAADMLFKLTGAYSPPKPKEDPPQPDIITPEFKKALKARDVHALERIVFNSEDNTA